MSLNMTLKNQYENVNHLVLNFYSDGYSIAVKLNEFPVFTSETILETARISYEEHSLLDYIESEELPPLLVEMIDSSPKLSQYKIWHNGCLILEVRDRISHLVNDSPNSESFFILLKPTNLSMLYDVLNLTNSSSWSALERLQLESQIVLHNSPSLSLEPDNLDRISKCSDQKKLPHTKLKDTDQRPTTPVASDCIPPQLTLQQFVATKKSRRKSLNGLKPNFYRFKNIKS